MKVLVQLSSGEIDTWEDVADALFDEGCVQIVSHIEGDEIPGDTRTVTVVEHIEQDGRPGVLEEVPMATKSTTFELNALYAPGMWMKVEFE